jgi:hypothetical protein
VTLNPEESCISVEVGEETEICEQENLSIETPCNISHCDGSDSPTIYIARSNCSFVPESNPDAPSDCSKLENPFTDTLESPATSPASPRLEVPINKMFSITESSDLDSQIEECSWQPGSDIPTISKDVLDNRASLRLIKLNTHIEKIFFDQKSKLKPSDIQQLRLDELDPLETSVLQIVLQELPKTSFDHETDISYKNVISGLFESCVQLTSIDHNSDDTHDSATFAVDSHNSSFLSCSLAKSNPMEETFIQLKNDGCSYDSFPSICVQIPPLELLEDYPQLNSLLMRDCNLDHLAKLSGRPARPSKAVDPKVKKKRARRFIEFGPKLRISPPGKNKKKKTKGASEPYIESQEELNSTTRRLAFGERLDVDKCSRKSSKIVEGPRHERASKEDSDIFQASRTFQYQVVCQGGTPLDGPSISIMMDSGTDSLALRPLVDMICNDNDEPELNSVWNKESYWLFHNWCHFSTGEEYLHERRDSIPADCGSCYSDCKLGRRADSNWCLIQCVKCNYFFHADCVAVLPATFISEDVYFIFVCAGCNSGSEFYSRIPVNWLEMLYLVMVRLGRAEDIEADDGGYFHVHSHILPFIW